MGVALKDLKGRVKRPVRSVTICLDGDLWARHDELTQKLDELGGSNPARMGQAAGAREVAEEIKAVEAAMRESTVTVQFRGISSYEFKLIQARFPSDDKNMAWDVDAGAHALIAACAVEPTTEDEAREFLESVHQAAAGQMLTAAFLATTGSSEFPNSVRASALTAGSGSN